MSRKVTVEELNGEVARTSFSSEHDEPQYFDKDGRRLAVVEKEVDYKPEYDFETRRIKHWWFRDESELFVDVHTLVAKFRSRTTVGKYWKALRKKLAHQYIWRHFG